MINFFCFYCALRESRGGVCALDRRRRSGARHLAGVPRGPAVVVRMFQGVAPQDAQSGVDLGRMRRQPRVRLQVRITSMESHLMHSLELIRLKPGQLLLLDKRILLPCAFITRRLSQFDKKSYCLPSMERSSIFITFVKLTVIFY